MRQEELLQKWEEFKEVMGEDHALKSLEQAIGTDQLSENAEYIMRVEDFYTALDEDTGM